MKKKQGKENGKQGKNKKDNENRENLIYREEILNEKLRKKKS